MNKNRKIAKKHIDQYAAAAATKKNKKQVKPTYTRIAQQVRACGSYPQGREFESLFWYLSDEDKAGIPTGLALVRYIKSKGQGFKTFTWHIKSGFW